VREVDLVLIHLDHQRVAGLVTAALTGQVDGPHQAGEAATEAAVGATAVAAHHLAGEALAPLARPRPKSQSL